MKKIITAFFIILLVAICSSLTINADNTISSQEYISAKEVAQSELEGIKAVFKTNLNLWGFKDIAEVESLVLGEGKRVLYPDFDMLSKTESNSIYEWIDESKKIWAFDMESNGIPKASIWIICENGNYRLVQYSGIDETSYKMQEAAKKIATENGLSIAPELFNTFGTNNIILVGNDKEYILPIEFFSEQRLSDNYNLNFILFDNSNGYVLSSKDFTNGLKTMITSEKANTNGTNEIQYGGLSVYNYIPSDPTNNTSTNIFVLVASAFVVCIVISITIIFLQKRKIK